MKTIRIHTGAMPEDPLFSVYLNALRSPLAEKILVQAESCDKAIHLALKAMRAPECAFVAVYHENPTPPVNTKYGASIGRASSALDHDSQATWKANKCPLDSGGYDKGGAYWGCRDVGQSLYAVQDGMGNIRYFDASSNKQALQVAEKEEF